MYVSNQSKRGLSESYSFRCHGGVFIPVYMCSLGGKTQKSDSCNSFELLPSVLWWCVHSEGVVLRTRWEGGSGCEVRYGCRCSEGLPKVLPKVVSFC